MNGLHPVLDLNLMIFGDNIPETVYYDMIRVYDEYTYEMDDVNYNCTYNFQESRYRKSANFI